MELRRNVKGPLGQTTEPPLIADDACRKVIGAAIEVHGILGPGFLEHVYEEALAIELEIRNISFVRQSPHPLLYKGQAIGTGRADLMVEKVLIVELKAQDVLLPIHLAQVISYLKATELRLGLIINFNVLRLRDGIRRVVTT